jgi:membrane protein
VAYYALLSLFPFLLLLFSMVGWLTAAPDARDAVIGFVFRNFPRQFEFIAEQIDAFRSQTVQIGVGGSLALAWASLGVFSAVTTAVNHSWGVEKGRGFLHHRLFSFVMMLAAGAIFLAALVLASAIRVAEARWFQNLQVDATWATWLGGLTPDYAATALFIVCVGLIFRYVPHAPVRFGDVWPGAIATGLLWRGALAAFSWYARDLAKWSVHGSIASVVVFLLWVYVLVVILLYGVQMTAAYARLRHGEQAELGL